MSLWQPPLRPKTSADIEPYIQLLDGDRVLLAQAGYDLSVLADNTHDWHVIRTIREMAGRGAELTLAAGALALVRSDNLDEQPVGTIEIRGSWFMYPVEPDPRTNTITPQYVAAVGILTYLNGPDFDLSSGIQSRLNTLQQQAVML